jgi:16S rRNA (guanine527-N7)-methyltransferase
MSIICELSAGFVRPGGKLVFYKGAKAKDEIAQAKKAFSSLGLADCGIKKYAIKSEEDETYMVILKKRGKLPSAYPRPYAKIIKSK